jgi:hypothetical protein
VWQRGWLAFAVFILQKQEVFAAYWQNKAIILSSVVAVSMWYLQLRMSTRKFIF